MTTAITGLAHGLDSLLHSEYACKCRRLRACWENLHCHAGPCLRSFENDILSKEATGASAIGVSLQQEDWVCGLY